MKKQLLLLIAVLFCSQINYSQVISMIGSTSPSGSWGVDTDMTTTDNITYTLNNVVITTATDPATTGLKFRQGHDWTVNWGSANFPSGTGTQGGANIMTTAGTYDVTFNKSNGTYTFIPSGFPSIGIWGPAVDSQNGFGGPDVDMTTTDGITYTLSSFIFSSGTAYFRVNNDGSNTLGSVSFPTGIAVQGGPSIQVTGGEWFVTFNRNTGAYSFDFPGIAIVGEAVGGWPGDAGNPGPKDVHQMNTTDGFTYTITNLHVTDAIANGGAKFRQDNSWTFAWGHDSFPSATFSNGFNIPTVAGTYDVTFTRSSGAYNFTPSLATANSIKSSFKIYPNPTNNIWNLSHTTLIDSVELFDITGKTIQSFKPNAIQFELDGTALSQGVYFVKVKSGLESTVQKIIRN